MATKTKEYQLIKPDETDFYKVADFNDNADKIDEALSNKSDSDHLHETITNPEIDSIDDIEVPDPDPEGPGADDIPMTNEDIDNVLSS